MYSHETPIRTRRWTTTWQNLRGSRRCFGPRTAPLRICLPESGRPRPQRLQRGLRFRIASTRVAVRRFCARGRAHSVWLRLCRAARLAADWVRAELELRAPPVGAAPRCAPRRRWPSRPRARCMATRGSLGLFRFFGLPFGFPVAGLRLAVPLKFHLSLDGVATELPVVFRGDCIPIEFPRHLE